MTKCSAWRIRVIEQVREECPDDAVEGHRNCAAHIAEWNGHIASWNKKQAITRQGQIDAIAEAQARAIAEVITQLCEEMSLSEAVQLLTDAVIGALPAVSPGRLADPPPPADRVSPEVTS